MQRIKIIFLILLLFSTIKLFSQSSRMEVDSLLVEYQSGDNNRKVINLIGISEIYQDFDLDSGLHYANKALTIANEINNNKEIACAFKQIGNIYLLQEKYDSAEVFLKRSLKLTQEFDDCNDLKEIYNLLGFLFKNQNEYQQALLYFNKALEESIKLGNEKEIVRVYRSIGTLYMRQLNYPEAIASFQKAINLAKQINDLPSIADLYERMGGVYNEIAVYDESLKYFLEAILKFNNLKDTINIARVNNNIGLVYLALNKNDKAFEYLSKALEIVISTNNLMGQVHVFRNIGNVYKNKKVYVKALDYYNKSYQIAKKLELKEDIAGLVMNIGLVYMDSGEYRKAYANLLESLKLFEDLNDTYYLIVNYIGLANLSLLQKKYDQTLLYLDQASLLNKDLKINELLKESYNLYSTLYYEQNDFKNSLEYYKQYSQVNDSILNEKSNNKIIEMEIKYEVENISKQNELLKKDNQINNLEINRQKNIKRFLIAISILLLTLVILIFKQYWLKQKTSSLLETKNSELMEANKRLRISEYNLNQLNITKDKFFSIIAHDLKNPFQSILGFSEFIYNQADDLSKKDVSEYSKLIYESSKGLYNLLENLLHWSRTQLGTIQLNPTTVNLYNVAENITSIFEITANKKNIKIENLINKDVNVFVDNNVLSTVLRNLVNNALKYTYSGGQIVLSVNNSYKRITVSVKDTGMGISLEDLEKLFSIDQGFSKKGTENESGTGLGLILCKELIHQSKGEIYAESVLGEGSNFMFILPKAE